MKSCLDSQSLFGFGMVSKGKRNPIPDFFARVCQNWMVQFIVLSIRNCSILLVERSLIEYCIDKDPTWKKDAISKSCWLSLYEAMA